MLVWYNTNATFVTLDHFGLFCNKLNRFFNYLKADNVNNTQLNAQVESLDCLLADAVSIVTKAKTTTQIKMEVGTFPHSHPPPPPYW
jgi:hypothetical protein